MNQQPESLAEKAYRLIEEMIVTLELPPGSSFSESDLSQKLDIGRTPIREALQRLSAERLVSMLPRRGMIISEINIADHLALLETRRVLDRLIASRAARRATQSRRDELKELADTMLVTALDRDLTAFMRLDRNADRIMEAAARNAFAVRACASLHAHCRRFWYMYQENGDLGASAKLHAGVMSAVANSDEIEASTASDRLLDYLDQFTRSALDL